MTDSNATDSSATDGRSAGDRLLELMVFGPAGLAVTIVEEYPKLVEKGRHRIEGRVHTARLVGQFAFQMGRRQLEESLGHLGAHKGAPGSEGATAGGARHGDDLKFGHSARPGHPIRTSGPTQPSGPNAAPSVWPGAGVANGRASASGLAIPGYDSLSASQVVQRLEGLSSLELEEVRAHEATHRQRRTILHRVEQLLDGGHGLQP